MILNEEINETDLTSIPEDFTPGDFVYIELTLDTILMGTVEKITALELSVRSAGGTLDVFNKNSDPALSYVMNNIGKPPNLFEMKPGTIISRLNGDREGNFFREYAKVTGWECGRGIMPYRIDIEYLNPILSGQEKETLMTKYQDPLDRQMRYWTIEA